VPGRECARPVDDPRLPPRANPRPVSRVCSPSGDGTAIVLSLSLFTWGGHQRSSDRDDPHGAKQPPQPSQPGLSRIKRACI
jgi:hypothetical protein